MAGDLSITSQSSESVTLHRCTRTGFFHVECGFRIPAHFPMRPRGVRGRSSLPSPVLPAFTICTLRTVMNN
jgi:hypothetical protein